VLCFGYAVEGFIAVRQGVDPSGGQKKAKI